jgi:hypothetical protein
MNLDESKLKLQKEIANFSSAFVKAKKRGETQMTLTEIDNLIRQEIFTSVLSIVKSKVEASKLLNIHRNLFYTERAK